MLRVAVRPVVPGKDELLRAWFAQVDGPCRDEALATLDDEGCRHELAFLLEGPEGPVLVHVMEVEDVDASLAGPAPAAHPIDLEHRLVMAEALGPPRSTDLVLDLHP